MLLRVVRMEFHEESLDTFEGLFHNVKSTILSMPGCNHVEMCLDPDAPNVRYTFSRWDSEEDLDTYRKSEFFEVTWEKIKGLFSGKPFAYSLLSD